MWRLVIWPGDVSVARRLLRLSRLKRRPQKPLKRNGNVSLLSAGNSIPTSLPLFRSGSMVGYNTGVAALKAAADEAHSWFGLKQLAEITGSQKWLQAEIQFRSGAQKPTNKLWMCDSPVVFALPFIVSSSQPFVLHTNPRVISARSSLPLAYLFGCFRLWRCRFHIFWGCLLSLVPGGDCYPGVGTDLFWDQTLAARAW